MAPEPPPPPPTAAPSSWRRAQVETTIKLSTTGGCVWGAAEAAIAFFERHWDTVVVGAEQDGGGEGDAATRRRSLRVLELGAGCGKLGLTIALNCRPAVSVLLTEQPDGLEHLERNVRLNDPSGDLDARAVACDWGDFVVAAAEAEQDAADDDEALLWRSCARVAPPSHKLPVADVIVGSDLIYLLEGAHALPRTLSALLRRAEEARRKRTGDGADAAASPSPVAYYSHTRHRFDALDLELEQQCAACGLEMVELGQESGKEVGGGRGGSPPPFTELFPEHRVAMYRIRLMTS